MDTTAGTGPSREVALIDDDLCFTELLAAQLTKRGCTVHNFKSGQEFLGSPARAWDLVVVDYLMPQMNGVETVSQMKPEAKAKAVILTGSAPPQDDQQYMHKIGLRFHRKAMDCCDKIWGELRRY